MKIVKFEDGVAVLGEFQSVASELGKSFDKFNLVHADPPYGNILDVRWDRIDIDDSHFTSWMIDWTNDLEKLILDRGALYVWGGIGRPKFRPFYRYLAEVECVTNFQLANHITWKKKRAYGVQHNYLFTREELAYLHKGDDIKKPHIFNVPLLSKLRGYAGYDEKHPAKSEYLRRTNVWDDITEIFRGKMHGAQKPVAIVEIPIQIHTNPGDWVLDPFAGSGTTAIACRKNDRKFVVVEKDPAIFEKMVARIRSGNLNDVVPGLEPIAESTS